MADATPSAPDVGVYDAVELSSSAASAYVQQLPQDKLIESSIEGAVNEINKSLDEGINLFIPQNAFQEKLVDKINDRIIDFKYESEISTIIQGYYIGDDFQQHGLEKINYDQLLEAASRADGITPERQEIIQNLRDNPNIDNLIKQVNEDGGLSQFILNGQGFLDHLKGTDFEIKNPNEFFNGHSTKPDFTGENIVMPDGSMPKAKLLNDDAAQHKPFSSLDYKDAERQAELALKKSEARQMQYQRGIDIGRSNSYSPNLTPY